MVEPLKAWQCVGCGRIDHPQPCIGVCRDQKVELVYASQYRELEQRAAQMEALLRRVAATHPRNYEGSYRAFQEQARRLLG